MANIDSQLSKIRSAERGEDVRDQIVSALRSINNDVPPDMANPIQITGTMEPGSDLTIPVEPPKLVSQVFIRQAGSGGKNTNLVEGKFTENGTYPDDDPDYDPSEERRYYKKVEVNVKQLANKVIDLEEEITQNGTYSAFDWGADGLRSFTVNVNPAPVSGTFEVEFYESTTAATPRETQLVPAYGSAIPTFVPTPPAGQNFVGWNPSPTNVTRNLKCYPRFADTSVVVGEIEDSWEVICQKGGAGYPLGAFKSLSYDQIFSYDECVQYGVDYTPNYRRAEILFSDVIFYKVAEGESGSKSTWLSRPAAISLRWSSADSGDNWLGWGNLPYPGGYHQAFNWPDRLERKFFNMMMSKMDLCFQQHIAEVIKYTQTSTSGSAPYHVEPTNDRLWIPSIKEIYIDGWDTTDNIQGGISKDKYVTNVSGGLAYMNDILALTPKQRHDALLLNGTTTYFRDAGSIWDQSPIMNSGSEYEGENVWFINGGGRHDNGLTPTMLGFCLV